MDADRGSLTPHCMDHGSIEDDSPFQSDEPGVCVCVAMPHAASGVHVQSIDDNTFRSDTPACSREERRVVSVGTSARGLHAENACVVSAGRGKGSARGRALPC